jgi:putative peptidoglycan lipid II flippase
MNSPKKFAGLSIVVIINLALQFLFQWYIIVSFGAGTVTDAFFGAMAVPQFILLVLSGSLTLVLVPILSQYSGITFLKEAWTYFIGAGVLFTCVALLLLFTAQWWVHFLFPSFKGDVYVLSLNLARIQLLAMVLSAMLSVVWAIHSAKENFFVIEGSSIIANIIALVLLFFVIKYYGIYAAAWVSVVRVLLQLVFLAKILGPYQKPGFNSQSFKTVWQKLRPLLAGNMYYKTDMLIDRHLTSIGANGELTLFNLAQQIYSAGYSILSKVLVNTMVPQMAKANAAGDEKQYGKIFTKRLFLSLTITLGVFILLVILGKWGLGFIFSFKNFDSIYIPKLWWVMIFLAGYWIFGLLCSITATAFYAKGNTVTPTRLGAILFTFFIPVKIFCYYRYGISGLAVAISIYYLTSFVIQLFLLKKHLKKT